MSDTPGTGAEQQAQPPVIINGQYIKDLSFESPNSPGILAELNAGQQPDINVNVNVNSTKLEGEGVVNMFEVVLELSATMKVGEKTGFIAELQYAGVFSLNVPEEHLTPMQLIECPRLLFPFARSIMSDVTRDGGFVPLLLQPIDFAGLFQANAQQQAADLGAQVEQMAAEKGEG